MDFEPNFFFGLILQDDQLRIPVGWLKIADIQNDKRERQAIIRLEDVRGMNDRTRLKRSWT